MTKRYKKKAAIKKMNALGTFKTPFFFLIDFEMKKIIIEPNFNYTDSFLFTINGLSNHKKSPAVVVDTPFIEAQPLSFKKYKKGFDLVTSEIQNGNSYLLNLTYPTKLKSNVSLEEIYNLTDAKYKVLLKEKFVCFSPEIFVIIKNNRISSFPMKGTIDANIENAQETLLNDKKELAEHYTIVDLIRNDIGIVATDITVNRFRYIEKLKTNKKNLLQASSEISGNLPSDWSNSIGDILFNLLPAGSISGAPKQKTIEIIKTAEKSKRSYYTGICGIFDGVNLDTGVMIRYIEKKKDKLYYRSGCGITSMSDINTEYQEMIDKVYLPLNK
ncbi:MAG: aminodeoxychorismate synthase component I [Saprospiraceae bacterium]